MELVPSSCLRVVLVVRGGKCHFGIFIESICIVIPTTVSLHDVDCFTVHISCRSWMGADHILCFIYHIHSYHIWFIAIIMEFVLYPI